MRVVFFCIIFVVLGDIAELYKTLEIEENATTAQIRKAYRKLSLKYHPDKNPGDSKAKDKFLQVQDAYDKLSDEDARNIYARFGDQEFHSKWQFDQAQKAGKIKGEDGGFYKNSDVVVTLNNKNFRQTKEGPWFVKFYAPWCVHCQHAIHHIRKAAILLEGEAKVGAVNCEANKRLCNKLGVRSYPSMQFRYLDEDMDFETYEGDHNAEQFYTFVMENKNSGLDHLDFMSFQDEVIDSPDVWLVTFSAGSWCPPCQFVKSAVRRTSFRLKGFVKVGTVNCDENKELCGKEGISYYPAFKLFPRGAGKQGIVINYGNSRFPQFDMLNLIADVAPLMMPEGEKNYTNILTELFEEYDKDRLEEIDELLEDWKDREDDLIDSLNDRYKYSHDEL